MNISPTDNFSNWFSTSPQSTFYPRSEFSRRNFFRQIESRPQFDENSIVFWPIIIVIIVAFLIWSEYGSQDCQHQNCHNKAEPLFQDDLEIDILDKISRSVIRNHTIVHWRRSLLVAIVVGLIIVFLFCPQFPHGFTVLVVIFIIFFIVYFSSAWFGSHWWKMNDYKIESSLENLRNKILINDEYCY